MDERESEWVEVFQHRASGVTMYVYENCIDRSIDVVQVNDDGESITTHLLPDAAQALIDSVR